MDRAPPFRETGSDRIFHSGESWFRISYINKYQINPLPSSSLLVNEINSKELKRTRIENSSKRREFCRKVFKLKKFGKFGNTRAISIRRVFHSKLKFSLEFNHFRIGGIFF